MIKCIFLVADTNISQLFGNKFVSNIYKIIFNNKKCKPMLRYAIIFLIVAIVAAIFGFGGIAGTAAGIAKILFYIFVVLFIISLVTGKRK